MQHKALTLGFALGFAFLVAGQLAAAEPSCKADLEQFCSNVTPGHGRKWACLTAYGDKLSDSCLQWRHNVVMKHRDFMQACGADIKKLCAGKKEGDLHKCMTAHSDDLSEACQSKLHPQKQQ